MELVFMTPEESAAFEVWWDEQIRCGNWERLRKPDDVTPL
jgi:hypothetical protein